MKMAAKIVLASCALWLLIPTALAQDQLPVPDSEVNTPLGWLQAAPSILVFRVDLHTLGGDCVDFTGRYIKEEPFIPGTDSCWFFGSKIDYQWGQGIYTPPDAPPLPGNYYFDKVGWPPYFVNYYRVERAGRGLPLACGADHFQQMSMDDGWGGWTPYFWNELTMYMDASVVCASRAGVGDCRVFP